jgi:hypothetical protein
VDVAPRTSWLIECPRALLSPSLIEGRIRVHFAGNSARIAQCAETSPRLCQRSQRGLDPPEANPLLLEAQILAQAVIPQVVK